MTRTARATFPRAMNKDRSESKSGHRDDKHMRKDGGWVVRSLDVCMIIDSVTHSGPHGWGRLSDEKDLEEAAMQDEVDVEDSEGSSTSHPETDPTLTVIYRNHHISPPCIVHSIYNVVIFCRHRLHSGSQVPQERSESRRRA